MRWLGNVSLCGAVVLFFLLSDAKADSVNIHMQRTDQGHVGTPLGAIWAVDSWFLTLVTLDFKLSGVPEGSYEVLLYDLPECAHPGDVYNPFGDTPGQRVGDLLPEMVSENGALTGIHGIKPPTLTADSHKLTVIEMRGHALLLRSKETKQTLACGIVGEGEWEQPR